MAYELPTISYNYCDLEPYVDGRTMEIHHLRHHRTYLDKLNSILERYPELKSRSLEEIVGDISQVPEEIRQDFRNFCGGHLNHSLLWQVIGPNGGGEPSGVLFDAICSKFNSFSSFRDEFTKVALSRFGSGWAWLCLDSKGSLEVVSTANQDSPIMMGLTPILGIDLWEHAYYLKYQNRRDEYIKAFWNVINWSKVGEIFELRRTAVVQTTRT
jgi:Fe-Mn family superoxide dismutase